MLKGCILVKQYPFFFHRMLLLAVMPRYVTVKCSEGCVHVCACWRHYYCKWIVVDVNLVFMNTTTNSYV